MAKTVRDEVRRDENGKSWLWRVTESDVEGEGGSERLGEVTRASISRDIATQETAMEEARAALAGMQTQLAYLEARKAEIVSAGGG